MWLQYRNVNVIHVCRVWTLYILVMSDVSLSKKKINKNIYIYIYIYPVYIYISTVNRLDCMCVQHHINVAFSKRNMHFACIIYELRIH